MDKVKIEKEAKKILDKFASALDNIGKHEENFYVHRDESERVENGESCDGFKSKLLENAPQKNSDFIIAEKGSWKNNVKTKS